MHELDWPLRFGGFIAPYHTPNESPTLSYHRDVEYAVRMDALGFDEVWCGEHHSTGYETIPSPEMFLAHVAAKTQRIKLGTGVVSVPYHNPFMVATRAVFLDHLTRGRMMLGMGPGALPTDLTMFNLDPMDIRSRMEQGIDAILALLRGETVTRDTEWFTLTEARLQVLPYTRPCFPIAVTAVGSANGPQLAGRLGAGILSLNATTGVGREGLTNHWGIAEESAAAYGTEIDRRNWRVVGPMHIAATREQVLAEVRYGLAPWLKYFTKIGPFDLIPDDASPEQWPAYLNDSGFAVIGTPDDAIAFIEKLLEISGGFGGFMLMHHEWAEPEATWNSLQLIARHVMPHFTKQLPSLRRSEEIAIASKESGGYNRAKEARAEATRQYQEKKAAREAPAIT
jgi:limonene 1,2-monooxygenase